MRRRGDDWVNATHILKAAGFDKPARTRILEREVQKGVHEKVQGGYGKYQGMDLTSRMTMEETERLLMVIIYRNMDSPPRGPSACRAQQHLPQASSHLRLCCWRSQPPASAETLVGCCEATGTTQIYQSFCCCDRGLQRGPTAAKYGSSEPSP